jgi:hypothetical protein
MAEFNQYEAAGEDHKHTPFSVHSIQPFTYLCGGDQGGRSKREQSLVLPDGSEDWTKSPLSGQRIDLTDLRAREPALPNDIVDKLVPSRVTTLLAAHGGAGKSMLALQMAVCVATGRPFMGCEVQQAPVTFYSAEDDRTALTLRLVRILDLMGIDDSEVKARLHLLDMTDYSDPALFVEGSYPEVDGSLRRGGRETGVVNGLSKHCEITGSQLLIVDNASDVFAADENTRTLVRRFIHSLSDIARETNGGVMLLAHVDKETARYAKHAEGYSGSTAWHNSARSRLFLTANDDGVTLKHEKANHGPRADDIALCWRDGVLVDEHALTPQELMAREKTDMGDMVLILRFLKAATDRGESISTSRTAENAYKVLCRTDGFPRLDRNRFWGLVDRALQKELLKKVMIRTSARNQKEVFEVTAAGCRFL